MMFFKFLSRFFSFLYFWMLFFMTIELIYRPLALKQKMYQLSEGWIVLAVVINLLLIANYLRGMFAKGPLLTDPDPLKDG